MRATDRSAVAVVIAMVLASMTLTPLTTDRGFLGASWILIIMVGLISALLRRIGRGSVLVLLVQLSVWLIFVLITAIRLPSPPGLGLSGHLAALAKSALLHMHEEAAPMSPNDGVRWVLIGGIGLIAIMTDLLVLGVDHPAWGLAPTATLFLIPALGLGEDTGVGAFLLIALGYVAILIAEGLNNNAGWTRGLSRDSADEHGTADPVVWRAAASIGLPAIVLTAVLGLIIPTITLNGLGIGNGPGGNGPIQLADPTLDLKRNLMQPRDATVLTYRTEGVAGNEVSGGGVYLRMASLPAFSRAGWQNTQTPIERGTQLPEVPGLLTEANPTRRTSIRIEGFRSEYLPMPYAPRQFQAAGDWGIDPNSLVVISAAGSGRARSSAIENLSYTVDSVDVEPSAGRLSTEGAGLPQDSAITNALPPDLPNRIVDLARQVTGKAENPAAKASAIQAYLRDPDNFTYSTDPQPGSGYQALTNFLFNDKRGYCEQFAASMAVMARVVGIPSRVAVGFLPGDRTGPGTWSVSARDMHAWPELYFADFGWVRYEPTPASVTGNAPGWTVPTRTRDDGQSSDEPSSSSSADQPTPTSQASNRANQAPTTTSATAGQTNLGRNLLIGAGALVLLALLAAPASIRFRRRNSRLADDQQPADRVEAAWSEVRDTVIDLGDRWPAGSPRAIGGEVGEWLETDRTASMTQLAVLVERSRYAQSFDDDRATAELGSTVGTIRRDLTARQPWHRRLRALLAPRSVFRRRRP